MVVAVLVSVTVDLGARNRVSAERNRIEALLLSRLSATEVGGSSVDMLLDQMREIFGMTSVELVKQVRARNICWPLSDPRPTGEPTARRAQQSMTWHPDARTRSCSATTPGCWGR